MLSITREPEIRERLTAQINELRFKLNGLEGRSAIEYRSADKAGAPPTEKELDELIWRKQAELALDDAEFEIKYDGVK